MSDIVKESGALFYSPPEAMDAWVDPLIRHICEEINRSGWVWTAESCQGHPDANESGAWGDNTSPMLRLVTREADEGRMFHTLMRAYVARDQPKRADSMPELHGMRIHPNSRPSPGWTETLIYIEARNVYQRNQALEVWRDFAKAVGTKPQTGLKGASSHRIAKRAER